MSSYSSVLRYPRFDNYVIVHDWQLFAADKNKAGAALLHVFEMKHQAIVENREFDREVRDAMAAAGMTPPPDFKFWFSFDDKELLRRVKIAQKEAIYIGIKILKDKGLIETEPPKELTKFLKTGSRKWFRFCAHKVQPVIDEYDKMLWGERKKSDTANLPATPATQVPDTLDELERMVGKDLTTQAREVFDDWRELISPKSVADPKRLKLAVVLLKMGIAKERLFLATRGVLMFPHNLGFNDQNRKHIGFDLIFRDMAHFEKYETAATDTGLTTENYMNYEISLKNPRLRKKQAETAKESKADGNQSIRAESAPEVYERIGIVVADGIAVLEADENILNTVSQILNADDFFIRERLLEAIRTAATSRAPLDKSGALKADRVVAQLIELQKGL